MRTAVLLAMITPLVLIPACTQVTPTASPQTTASSSPAPSATAVPPTPTQQAMPTPEPTATPEPTPTATSQPTPTPVEATPPPEPPEECLVEDCEPYQEIALYHSFSDEQSFSRLVPGTNKVFLVKDRQGGRMLIEVTEPSGAKWEAWADDNPGAYGPVGEVPPYPVCEAPHFGGRTPDRKTGIVIKFGNERQEIYPEGDPISPYYMWTEIQAFGIWVIKKSGRITAIDRENGIITFDFGGLIAKRNLTKKSRVIMRPHKVYAGMPMNEYEQMGGNLCDLEVGDAAAILHPSEGEGANPSPGGPLWGVLIVQ